MVLLLHFRPLGRSSSIMPTISRYCCVRALRASAPPSSSGPGLASEWLIVRPFILGEESFDEWQVTYHADSQSEATCQ